MKYERIERSLDETAEFFKSIHWIIEDVEIDLILNKMKPEEFLTFYDYEENDLRKKSKMVIDFFFKQVEEFEEGPWCWFWDNNLDCGVLSKFRGTKKIGSTTYYITCYGSEWKNCISIKEFRERLKEYL